eukprot:gene11554-12601_t
MLNDRSDTTEDDFEAYEDIEMSSSSRCEDQALSSVESMKDQGETSYASKYSNLFVFSGGNKAGMQAMDKEKQAQIIYEMSKDSAYFKRTVKLDEEATIKAQKLRKSFEQVSGPLAQRLQQTAHQKYLELEKRRRINRICCVLDMDMFFAAVEIRDRPELKDLPVAVGGIGMISTSNYVARQYGVRAAMPGFIAKKLCPNLVFVNCNFDKYQIVSKQMKEIIEQYDPHYRSWSLDEVYFDLTDASIKKYYEIHGGTGQVVRESKELEEEDDDETNHDQMQHSSSMESTGKPSIFDLRSLAAQLLQDIRKKITEVTNGLTCSAGIANNFMLAKICADINKPNGQYELTPTREGILQFIMNLPTRKVGGIGKVTEKILSELGIKTLADIQTNATQIIHAFTPTTSDFLMRVSLGIDSDEGVDPSNSSSPEGSHRKSIGCERTYSSKGISNRAELYRKLDELCIHLSKDISNSSSIIGGKTLTLKIKDVQFNLHTKAYTLPLRLSKEVIKTREQLFNIAKELLDSFLPLNVRLLGISLSKLQFQEEKVSLGALDKFIRMNKEEKGSSTSLLNDKETCCPDAIDLLNDGRSNVQDQTKSEDFINLLDEENIEYDEVIQTKDDESSSSSYTCPICNLRLAVSLQQYNQHIDDCLTAQSLREESSTDHQKDMNENHSVDTSSLFSKVIGSKKKITQTSSSTNNSQRKKLKVMKESTHSQSTISSFLQSTI